MPDPTPPSSSLRPLVVAAGLLALFATWAWHDARTHSATFDEPGFLVAGTSYLTPGAPEITTTNLRLAQLWLAAPLQPLQPKLPEIVAKLPAPIVGADSDLGRVFLADPRHDGAALLRRGRAAAIALGVALGAVLFAWARRLHGDGPALLTLALFCLNPVMVSNSALATTDVAVTLAFVAATWTAWRLLHHPTILNTLATGLALGALLSTKLSGLLIAPIFAVLLVVRLATERPFFTPRLWLRLALGLLGAGAVAWGVIWAVYGFRFTSAPLTPEAWAAAHRPDSALSTLAGWLHEHRLMPETWLADLRVFATSSGHRRTYLLGEHALDGWWYFFPVVWFFKTPFAALAALALGAVAAGLTWRRDPAGGRAALYALTPVLALGAIYGAATMSGQLNIGIRHWLPVFPLVFVVAGLAVNLPWSRFRSAVIALIVAASAFDAWRVREHPLAFVNALGGGTTHGYRTVVDSSFEWGGDLPALERWLAARRAAPGEKPPVYFSYFGNNDLKRWKIDAVLLPQSFDLRPASAYGLGPGTYVLSATMLQGVYGEVNGPWRPSLERAYVELHPLMQRLDAANTSPEALNAFIGQEGSDVWRQRIRAYDWLRFGRLCAWLRGREPSARITPGLLVFELSAENLRVALLDPPAELRPDDAIKGTKNLTQEQVDFRK
ncbi:MAG: glycosyltransferase family 39 protein [Opitutaceae bacterium]|nr:glycosyltransferase family 39 protein [Opitutaceae bacterium]